MIESLDRWWSNLTFPVRRRVFGWAPRVNWERGGLYLINFDQSLAEVIYNGIVSYRKYNRHVMYEDEDGNDLTEWWFEEVLWTFDTIRKGGAGNHPDVMALWYKASENATFGTRPSGEHLHVFYSEGMDEEIRDEWCALEERYQERVSKGLQLFAERFQSMWL